MILNAKNGIVPIAGTQMPYIRFGSGSKTLIMLPGLGDGLKSVRGTALPMAIMYRMCAREYTVYMFSRRDELPENADTAVIGIVSRLVDHKGFDLVQHVFEEIVNSNVQVVILGSGEWKYEQFFAEMAAKYPDKVALRTGFIPELAHKIYAGADIFLMPSKSEPCGLAQMVALRYGTIPIVRQTGGLNDTIRDSGDGEGNGFTFKLYNAHDMQNAVWRALEGYYSNRDGWNILKKRAMECDYSWAKSAGEYIKLYKSILTK